MHQVCFLLFGYMLRESLPHRPTNCRSCLASISLHARTLGASPRARRESRAIRSDISEFKLTQDLLGGCLALQTRHIPPEPVGKIGRPLEDPFGCSLGSGGVAIGVDLNTFGGGTG